MKGFFPSLPYVIPHSPGIAHWWDIFWWIFQLVVMTTLVLVLRHWAISFDRERSPEMKQTGVTAPSQKPGIPG